MGSSDVKSDIKTLFLIFNTLCGLSCGLLLVSAGVVLAVDLIARQPGPPLGLLAGGLVVLGVAALGYYGAIVHNKIMLIVYAVLMALLSVLDIVGLAMMLAGPGPHGYINTVFLLFQACMTLVAVALAVVLARRRDPRSQGCVLSAARPEP